MSAKGLKDFKVMHRLSTPTSGNPVSRGIPLYRDDSSILKISPIINKVEGNLLLKKIKKGIGYLKDDKLISTPFDFSGKNYYS